MQCRNRFWASTRMNLVNEVGVVGGSVVWLAKLDVLVATVLQCSTERVTPWDTVKSFMQTRMEYP